VHWSKLEGSRIGNVVIALFSLSAFYFQLLKCATIETIDWIIDYPNSLVSSSSIYYGCRNQLTRMAFLGIVWNSFAILVRLFGIFAECWLFWGDFCQDSLVSLEGFRRVFAIFRILFRFFAKHFCYYYYHFLSLSLSVWVHMSELFGIISDGILFPFLLLYLTLQELRFYGDVII